MKGKSRGRKRKSAEPLSPTPAVELSQEVTSTLTQNSSGKFVPKFSKKPKTSKSQPVPSLASHLDEQELITLSTSADHIASPSKSHDIPQQLHDSTLQLLDDSPLKSHDIPSQSHDNPSQSKDSRSQSNDVEQVINTITSRLYVKEELYNGGRNDVIQKPVTEISKELSDEYIPGLSLSQATIQQHIIGPVPDTVDNDRSGTISLQDGVRLSQADIIGPVPDTLENDRGGTINGNEDDMIPGERMGNEEVKGNIGSHDSESHDNLVVIESHNTVKIGKVYDTESHESHVIKKSHNTGDIEEYDGTTVEITNDTVEKANGTVEITNDTVEITNDTVEITNNTVEITNDTVEITNDTSLMTGASDKIVNNDNEVEVMQLDNHTSITPPGNNSLPLQSEVDVQLTVIENNHGNKAESMHNNSLSVNSCSSLSGTCDHHGNDEESIASFRYQSDKKCLPKKTSDHHHDDINSHVDHVTTMGEDGIGEVAMQQLDDSLSFEDMEDMYLDFDQFNTKPVEQVYIPVKPVYTNTVDTNSKPVKQFNSNADDTIPKPDKQVYSFYPNTLNANSIQFNIIDTPTDNPDHILFNKTGQHQQYHTITTVPKCDANSITSQPLPFQDQSMTLQSLVTELSILNQHVLRCKREMEAARKQRNTMKHHRW